MLHHMALEALLCCGGVGGRFTYMKCMSLTPQTENLFRAPHATLHTSLTYLCINDLRPVTTCLRSTQHARSPPCLVCRTSQAKRV